MSAGVDPKVAGLVYVAAFAPDEDETLMDIESGTSRVNHLHGFFLAFAQDIGKRYTT